MSLKQKIESKKAEVAVIGLGYVGLPLALEVVRAGFLVTGLDVDKKRLKLADIESQGAIKTTTDYGTLKETEIILICLPTPLTKTHEPDLSFVLKAARQLSAQIGKGKLLILESTTFPGTTEDVLLPIFEKGGLRVGGDFFLGFSPERIDPGNKKYSLKNTPKIVAGVTSACLEVTTSFYNQFIDEVVQVSSTRIAEMAKLLENIFRAVNVALVNELALLCDRMKIDVWEVVRAASTKPFGFMPFYPGPGLGGHCCPIDPFYLSWKAREYGFHTEFIELSGKINEHMPHYVVQKIGEALNSQKKNFNGSEITVLGITYKKDVKDIRQSPSIKIIELLLEKNAKVFFHDPYVNSVNIGARRYSSKPLTSALLSESDCVAIIADHREIDYMKVVKNSNLIVDARNSLQNFRNEKIFKI